MRKIKKRKIALLIILIVFLIIEIKAFTDSRATKLIEITANIVDDSGLLEDEKYILQAINEGESGYCITLPNVVNDKKISKYIIEQKEINKDNAKDEKNKEESENKVNLEENNISNEVNSEIVNNKSKESNKRVEKKPGEKLYLSSEEIENKNIKVIARL